MLGIDASLNHVYGVVDYQHHLGKTPLGDLSAFAHGFGGISRARGRELGATAGLGLSF